MFSHFSINERARGCVCVFDHICCSCYTCVFIWCFFFWKMCWWLYYSSFPFELSIPVLPSFRHIFAHTHTFTLIISSKWCDRKRRKVEFFFCDCYQYIDTHRRDDTATATAAAPTSTNKSKVMIVCGWVFEDKRCQDISAHIVILDVNTGHKIIRLNDQNRKKANPNECNIHFLCIHIQFNGVV